MQRNLIVAAAIALIGASPAFAADQFDLNCEGMVMEGRILAKKYPIRRVIHIDLANKRWCSDEEYLGKQYKCDRGRDFSVITDDIIEFENIDKKGKFGKSEEYQSFKINRHDGNYSNFRRFPLLDLLWQESGHCTIADFTGLPKPAF